jgi:hypothetical protein
MQRCPTNLIQLKPAILEASLASLHRDLPVFLGSSGLPLRKHSSRTPYWAASPSRTRVICDQLHHSVHQIIHVISTQFTKLLTQPSYSTTRPHKHDRQTIHQSLT